MRNLIAPLVMAISVMSLSAHAANTQQDQMKDCNAQAKTQSLSGDQRKTFMSSCLSAKPATTAANSQQEKMKACNADAKTKALKGDARKSFMSSCLKGQ